MIGRTERRRHAARTAVTVLALTAVLGACSGNRGVGDEDLLDVSYSPTPSEVVTTGPPPSSAPSVPTAPVTVRPPDQFFDLVIKGGDCYGLCAYEPIRFRVSLGTIVRVTNRDSRARTWVSDDGRTFDSGDIAPSATFRYKTDARGRFPFHDRVGEYIRGEMQVT